MDRLEGSSLSDRVRICLESCPCRKVVRRPVSGEGPSTAQVLFIGRNPGQEEDRQNRPFVGPAGKALDRFIRELGLNRSEVGILNLVKCFTPENREPTPHEVQTCKSKFMKEELQFFPDKRVIFLMGSQAAQAFIKDLDPITRIEGTFFKSPRSGIACVPMTHPSYWIRNRVASLVLWNRRVHEIRNSLEEHLDLG